MSISHVPTLTSSAVIRHKEKRWSANESKIIATAESFLAKISKEQAEINFKIEETKAEIDSLKKRISREKASHKSLEKSHATALKSFSGLLQDVDLSLKNYKKALAKYQTNTVYSIEDPPIVNLSFPSADTDLESVIVASVTQMTSIAASIANSISVIELQFINGETEMAEKKAIMLERSQKMDEYSSDMILLNKTKSRSAAAIRQAQCITNQHDFWKANIATAQKSYQAWLAEVEKIESLLARYQNPEIVWHNGHMATQSEVNDLIDRIKAAHSPVTIWI